MNSIFDEMKKKIWTLDTFDSNINQFDKGIQNPK